MKTKDIENDVRVKLEQYFKSVSEKNIDIQALLLKCLEVIAETLLSNQVEGTPLDSINKMDADLHGGWRKSIDTLHNQLLQSQTSAFDDPKLTIYQIAALQLMLVGNKNTARELLQDYYMTSFEIGTREVIGRRINKVRETAKKTKTIKVATTKKSQTEQKQAYYEVIAREIIAKRTGLSASAVANIMLSKNKDIKIKSDTLARKIAHLIP